MYITMKSDSSDNSIVYKCMQTILKTQQIGYEKFTTPMGGNDILTIFSSSKNGENYRPEHLFDEKDNTEWCIDLIQVKKTE